MSSLEEIDAEVEALEAQLEKARQRKLATERKRHEELTERETEAERLQREIEQLQRELGGNVAVSMESTTPQQHAPQSSAKVDARQECSPRHQAPRSQDVRARQPAHQQPAQVDTQRTCTSHPPNRQQQPSSDVAIRGASEQTKQRHGWEKPAWALPSEALPEESIQKESIQNPLLKAAKPGYERKVKEQDLALIQGKFVQHQEKKPDPRLVWIVVNIDGSKVGKIVMHLYGNVLPIVDIFLELKGLELKRGSNPQTFFVDDIDPCFHVFSGTANKFRGPSKVCYGVVLEGQDVIEKLSTASPDSLFTIKQSHIYPVKKAK